MKVACLWFSHPVDIKKLAENCLRLSPQICFRESDALFIEFGKCRRLYSEDGFLARLSVILRRLEMNPQVAIGEDVPDSLVLAKFQVRTLADLPLLALLDLADPFNQDPLLRKALLKMMASFQDLGIRGVRDFLKIPVSDLISRFGPMAFLCFQRARGEITLPWPIWKPDEIITEKTDFPYFEFYGELEPLLFELKKQLDHIFQRLWARQLKAQVIQVRIFCERNSLNPAPFRSFDFDFLFPQSTTKGALNVIKERLAKDFAKQPIRTPIEALQTTVLSTVPGTAGQRNLLHNREETREQLFSLLGQLGEAHGLENVFHADLTEDRRPEKSWKKITSSSQSQISTAQNLDKIPLRPTYLLRPEKIEITAGLVYIRKKPFRILKQQNSVERISGGWIEHSKAPAKSQSLAKTESLAKPGSPVKTESLVKSQVLAKSDSLAKSQAPAKPESLAKSEILTKPESLKNLEQNPENFVALENLENSYDRNYYQIELETGTTITVFQTPSQQYYLHGYFG